MIICAAIKVYFYNSTLGDENGEVIITGHRHANCFELLRDLGFKHTDYKELAQGFINNKNEFLDRKDAYAEAIQCGQLSSTTKWKKVDDGETELFSEDLY